jgi:hypothetical protein
MSKDVTKIDDLIETISLAIAGDKIPTPPIPSPLILAGARTKSGLSAKEITRDVLIRCQEVGIPIGALPSGADPLWEKQMYLMVEVILEHLIKNAKITVVLDPGIPITAAGANAGGPVVVQGSTTTFATGYGIIQ